MALEHNYYEKSIQLQEYLSEILCLPLDKIVVYEQRVYPLEHLNRICIKFGKYCFSIRKDDFYEIPTDFLVKDIISRYTTYIIDRINETNKEQ